MEQYCRRKNLISYKKIVLRIDCKLLLIRRIFLYNFLKKHVKKYSFIDRFDNKW